MPIYSYRCENCGHAEDVLQKMSASPLTVCPACGAEAYRKQVTAAGFQLKGSGWYVTDFRSPQNAPGAAKTDNKDAKDSGASSNGDAKSDKAAAPAPADASSSSSTKADSPAPAPAPKATPPATSS